MDTKSDLKRVAIQAELQIDFEKKNEKSYSITCTEISHHYHVDTKSIGSTSDRFCDTISQSLIRKCVISTPIKCYTSIVKYSNSTVTVDIPTTEKMFRFRLINNEIGNSGFTMQVISDLVQANITGKIHFGIVDNTLVMNDMLFEVSSILCK
jgi:hypothetical protein